MEYIRKAYGVPAKRGAMVKIEISMGDKINGKIVGSQGEYLRVKLVDMPGQKIRTYHPTYNIEYVGGEANRQA